MDETSTAVDELPKGLHHDVTSVGMSVGYEHQGPASAPPPSLHGHVGGQLAACQQRAVL